MQKSALRLKALELAVSRHQFPSIAVCDDDAGSTVSRAATFLAFLEGNDSPQAANDQPADTFQSVTYQNADIPLAGDLVLCIDDDKGHGLTAGSLYTVGEDRYQVGSRLYITVDNLGSFSPARFRLVGRKADGWRIWRGGINPVPGQRVQIINSKGEPIMYRPDGEASRGIIWEGAHHVRGYRVIEPAASSDEPPPEKWSPGDVLRCVKRFVHASGGVRLTIDKLYRVTPDNGRSVYPRGEAVRIERCDEGHACWWPHSERHFELHRKAGRFQPGDVIECIKTVPDLNVTEGRRYEVGPLKKLQGGDFSGEFLDDTGHPRGIGRSAQRVTEVFRLAIDEAAEEKAAARQFKPRDRVRVVRKVEVETGWANGWASLMDQAIGRTFTVSSVDRSGVYFSELVAGMNLGFPPSALELANDALQPGDRVKFHGEAHEVAAGPRSHIGPRGETHLELAIWNAGNGYQVVEASQVERLP